MEKKNINTGIKTVCKANIMNSHISCLAYKMTELWAVIQYKAKAKKNGKSGGEVTRQTSSVSDPPPWFTCIETLYILFVNYSN